MLLACCKVLRVILELTSNPPLATANINQCQNNVKRLKFGLIDLVCLEAIFGLLLVWNVLIF